MKKKKTRSSFALSPRTFVVWGSVFGSSILIWIASSHFRSLDGPALNGMIFGKGVLLLSLSCAIYGAAFLGRGIGIHFLPLVWLAASRSLWAVCVIPEPRFFIWLSLFLLLQVLILLLSDARKWMLVLVGIWGGLSWLFKFSFLLPLAFLGASPKRPYAAWLRWGGAAAALGWFVAFSGHSYFCWNWEGVWDLWIGQRVGIFLLLACLGFMDPKLGVIRYSLSSFLLLVVGAWVWGGGGLIGLWQTDLLTWISIVYAGFGFETLRRELLGDEWFHRWMGYAIGAALLGSVL